MTTLDGSVWWHSLAYVDPFQRAVGFNFSLARVAWSLARFADC